MGGARALIASLGASISLVSGAALSLLVVSFLFAYDGLSGGADDWVPRSALFVDGVDGHSPIGSPGRDGGSPGGQAVVLRTAASSRPVHDVVRRVSTSALGSETAGVRTRRPTPSATNVTDLGPATAPPAADPVVSRPATGDGVRDLGDDVTTTVGNTGDAAGNATAPLGPPVSQALQDALDVVQGLLKGATDKLAGTLDKTLPR
jgi:hypothetical protein